MVDSRRVVEIFLDLVRIDAVSGAERPVAEHIRAFLEPLGVEVAEDDAARHSGGDSGNLICRRGSGGDLLLLAHMDTARPTRDLKPRVDSGRIASDGTTILGADNRAGVAVLLHTFERAAAPGSGLGDFSAAFTICEETDLSGSRHLRPPDGVQAGAVFDSSYSPGCYIRSSYGTCTWTAVVHGRAAHAGLAPEDGINAIGIAARALAELPDGRVNGELVANVGRIEGGEAVNVVPDRALVQGEARSLAESPVDRHLASIEEAFRRQAQAAGASLEFGRRWDVRAFDLPAGAPICRRVEAAIRRAGREPQGRTSAGGSDANSLNAHGLPTVNLGIGARNPHANDEYIEIADLAAAAAIAEELVHG